MHMRRVITLFVVPREALVHFRSTVLTVPVDRSRYDASVASIPPALALPRHQREEEVDAGQRQSRQHMYTRWARRTAALDHAERHDIVKRAAAWR
jgi:hypothetical protein